MRLKNTENNYGLITILLHWLIATLIIAMLALGLYMVDLPISLQKLKLYRWHKEFGILVLMLATVRISWRLFNMTPRLPSYLQSWQKLAARAVHYAFYGFMFAMPLTGWAISSSAGLSVSFFGLFVLPDFVSASEASRHLFTDMHTWLAYGLIATIALHVAAVAEHIIIHKDNILRKMWP
jgi:cytochrome b561